MLTNGKRCPNAALPGSHYCGVPAHQALHGTAPPAAEADDDDAETDAIIEVVAEAAEAEADLDAVVEESLAPGEITVEEAVELEESIAGAAADVVEEEVAAIVAESEEAESPGV